MIPEVFKIRLLTIADFLTQEEALLLAGIAGENAMLS